MGLFGPEMRIQIPDSTMGHSPEKLLKSSVYLEHIRWRNVSGTKF